MTGKATSKVVNVSVNLPLLFVASVIIDIDLLIPGLRHRGPIHSLIIVSLLFLFIFIFYGKRITPYFIAVVQHIIGDYFVGGTLQVFWPVSIDWYGVGIEMTSLTNITIEWIFFLTSVTIMLKAKDARTLFQRHSSNLLLSVPVFTVLLPTLLSFPLYVPLELIIPHLIYLAIFTFSILIDLVSGLRMTEKSRFN